MTEVPALRDALQQVAERRYGRRRLRRGRAGYALIPLAAAAGVIFMLSGSPRDVERPVTRPSGKAHTVRVTPLPARPRQPFRILTPTLMSHAAGEAAYAKAANTSADEGRLVRAWSIPGVNGAAVFLTRGDGSWCVATREPPGGDFPGQWASGCNSEGGSFRTSGASLVVGDTYVAALGPDTPSADLQAPNARRRTLSVAAGRLVMVQGAPDGSRVSVHSDVSDTIELPRDERHVCSDGTFRDVDVEPPSAVTAGNSDPCSEAP